MTHDEALGVSTARAFHCSKIVSIPQTPETTAGAADRAAQPTPYRRAIVAPMILLASAVMAMPARAEDALVATCKAADLEPSIAACTKLLESRSEPDIVELAHQYRAYRLMSKGLNSAAVSDLDAALALKPAYYGLLNARANSYIALGNLDHATSDFDAALKLKPDYAPAYAGRSTVDFFRGDIDRTIADASESIRLDPKQFAGYNNRGAARREKGDYENALRDLNIAIRLSPFASRPLYQRGLTAFRKGDLQSALADYEAAIVLNPNETDAVHGRDAVKALLAPRAPASSPVEAPMPSGSRPPTVGTVWAAYTAKRLGVQLLVEKAKTVGEGYTYEENDDWIDRRPTSDGAAVKAAHFIRVLRKPAAQAIEEAIRERFVDGLPPEARANCRVRPYIPLSGVDAAKPAFEIAPTGAYAQRIDDKFRNDAPTTQADGGCGDYGFGAAVAYFEYHPSESKEKYLYVFSGFDAAYDEKSIRILPSEAPQAATAAPPATGTMPADTAARIWSVSLSADAHGTLFCEAVARGRTAEAGGDYTIRYRFETARQGNIVVTYAGPPMKDPGVMETRLDGAASGSFAAKLAGFGRENAIIADIDAATFKAETLAFAKADAALLQIKVGGRSFEAPVHGYTVINADLETCIGRLSGGRD